MVNDGSEPAAQASKNVPNADVGTFPIIPTNGNLIARPWGGEWLCDYKGLAPIPDTKWGESFEICAFEDDAEARSNPSTIIMADGTRRSLSELLAAAGPAILGEEFARASGNQIPLLPKTLDVGELLSVQAHPEGLTEAYIILEAEAGATLRLGFAQEVDPKEFGKYLRHGRQLQQSLLEAVQNDVGIDDLQAAIRSNFAEPDLAAEDGLSALGLLPTKELSKTLRTLKSIYWQVLNLLNEILVTPGMVIHNANPLSISSVSGRRRSAEIHALGNPQGREILALEVRCPGPTYRAWDNVRFPLREIDVETTLQAVNLKPTRPEDFVVVPEQLEGHPGVFRSVTDEAFTVYHLRPRPGLTVAPPTDMQWHTLHCTHGNVELQTTQGRAIAALRRGQAALIPVSMESYRLSADNTATEVVMVTVPHPSG